MGLGLEVGNPDRQRLNRGFGQGARSNLHARNSWILTCTTLLYASSLMARGQEFREKSRNSNTLAVHGRAIKSRSGFGRGVVKKASTRRASSNGFCRTNTRKPYTPNKYSPNEIALISSDQLWEDRDSKLVSNIKRLEFTSAFHVTE